MWNWLERLRNKPKEVRNRYAFMGAGLISAIVALVWLTTLSVTGIQPAGNEDGDETIPRGLFGQFFDKTKENIAIIIESTEEISEQVPAATSSQVVATTTDFSFATSTEESTEIPKREPRPVLVETKRATTASSTAQ